LLGSRKGSAVGRHDAIHGVIPVIDERPDGGLGRGAPLTLICSSG
jgi:hypothetical protein